MNGYQLIEEAYERGLKTSEVFRGYTKFYNEMCRFMDLAYFGVLGRDEEGHLVPTHVNGRGTHFSARRRFKRSDVLSHHTAERHDQPRPEFRFFVGSPKTRYNLICLDIDGNDSRATHRLAADVYLDLFDQFMAYTERSRNRNGHYLWLIIERMSEPLRFNALCNALSRVLRLRYHDLADVPSNEFAARKHERSNFFDGIKGTLHHDTRDLVEQVESERWQDENRGLLITMPCAGCRVLPEGEHQLEVFLRFLRRRNGRYINAIPEQHLWDTLKRLDEAEFNKLQPSPVSVRSVSITTNPYPCESTRGGEEAGKERWERLLAKARATVNPLARMRYASCLHFYQHGRHADDEYALVQYYENLNLNTGEDRSNRRLQRARESLIKHKAKTIRTDKVIYKPGEWLPLIKAHVNADVRRHRSLKYAYHVEEELLAAGLCLFTHNAFKENRSDRMHTCGQKAQLAAYERFAEEGLLQRAGEPSKAVKFRDDKKRVAVVKLLQLAGLIVLRDGNHVYGGMRGGVCDRFGLGPNHPRFKEFVDLFGDVRDLRSLPILEASLKAAG